MVIIFSLTRQYLTRNIKQITGDHENCFVVNGQWLPTIQILPGEVTRFRIVNAAAAESLSLSLEYDADLFQEQSKDEV
eukprot:Awhi_evm2s11066